MPIGNAVQPDIIGISDTLRLRKYDGRYERFLAPYRQPYIYQNSEGIFDDDKAPDLDYVRGMCDYLSRNGEMYYIEVKEEDGFVAVGDVTAKEKNPPIAIWYEKYRGIGIGMAVMKTVLARLRELGICKVTDSEVYKWNIPSQKLHEKLGFVRSRETDDSIFYELDLCADIEPTSDSTKCE